MIENQPIPTFPTARIAQRPPSLWRYEEALPAIPHEARITFQEGFTPLVPYAVGKARVWLKLDYLFPTGSYKDRGATVLISHAHTSNIKHVVQDSSGNAGCAIAGYAGKAGIGCKIFVPADTSPAKIVQIRMYGAEVVLVEGDRQATAEACLAAAQNTYYASHVYNPLFLQGTKTFAYEVCEQMGWKAPDVVVLPAGNGTLLLGAYIGFQDLWKAGMITKLPRLVGVQAANCAPLYEAWQHNTIPNSSYIATPTLAEGIAIAQPYLGNQMLEAVRETGGNFIAVGEEAILKQLVELARQGYYVEPTSACVIAGLTTYLQNYTLPADAQIVSVLTGTGLKATEKILKIQSLFTT